MRPVLHVEECRTRPGSIVVGHLHTGIHLRGVIVAFHLSFVRFAFFGIGTVPLLAFFHSLFYFLVCRRPRLKASLPGSGFLRFLFFYGSEFRSGSFITGHFLSHLRQVMNWRSWLHRRESSPCSPSWRTITTASSAASSILPASTCLHASSGRVAGNFVLQHVGNCKKWLGKSLLFLFWNSKIQAALAPFPFLQPTWILSKNTGNIVAEPCLFDTDLDPKIHITRLRSRILHFCSAILQMPSKNRILLIGVPTYLP